MAGPKLEIVAGEVTDVQLAPIAYQAPAARGGKHAGPGGGIANKMRLFVRDAAGKEADYDIDDDDVGVRQGHRVVIVQATTRKAGARQAGAPVNLTLHNVSTGEHKEFTQNFAPFTVHAPTVGPRWKAAGLSLLLFALGYLMARFMLWPDADARAWITWPLIWALIAAPAFWALAGVWDKLTGRVRAERRRNALRAEIEARLAAHAPTTAAAND